MSHTLQGGIAYAAALMSDPRFKPRSYTSEPAAFGKALNIGWPDVGEQEQTRLLASKMQHLFSYEIQEAIHRSPHRTVKAYAEASGLEYQRLTKLLRGEAIMRLEDIADAYRRLGLPVPVPKRRPR